MTRRTPRFPIGSAPHASRAYGGGGIPHAYLIAPSGEVVWEGHPAVLPKRVLARALKTAEPFYLAPVLPALQPAADAYRRGRLAEAASLAKLARDADESSEIAEQSRRIRARVEKKRAYWLRLVGEGTADGRYDRVFDALDRLQEHFGKTQAGQKAEALERRLRKDPAVQRELKASRALERLRKGILAARHPAWKRDRLRTELERFITRYRDTKTAARARALLDTMEPRCR